METVGRILIVVVLLAAAGGKLRDLRAAATGMATFGFPTAATRMGAALLITTCEIALAVGVALGSDTAVYLAAALMAMLGLTLGSALMQGKAGAPCGCFGPGSRVSGWAVAQDLALAVAFAIVPSL